MTMARDSDLSSPLLRSLSSGDEQVVIAVNEDQSVDQMSHRHQSSNEPTCNGYAPNTIFNPHNPYSFLGLRGFTVPPSPSIDPFRNHTARIEGVYEWVKIVLCFPIALIRIVLFGACLVVGFVATKIALYGWRDKHNPMPKWRSRVMWITRVSARCILFCFGYQWIRRKGRPAPRDVAPIVVSNHVSYIEPIFYFYELFPTIVASESHDSIPFVGTIIRAMQVIYVNRFSPSSRKHAVNEIKRKASCGSFPRVLLFPEGTTSNGRVLISFQNGAFIPGYPIQPVVVRYPHVHFDQSWGHIALTKLMFRMFTQFHNFMEVEYLPVISLIENRKETALQFSKRTSHAISVALNVAQTSHSYGDLMLRLHAHENKQKEPSRYMVEMARVESSLHLSTLAAVEFLDKFLSMDPDSSGYVEIEGFLRVLRLKPCALSEKIFGFIDVEKIGKITYKQFLFGSAHVMKHPSFRHACDMAFARSVSESNYMSLQELGNSTRSAIPDWNEDEISQLFYLFDTDGDGKISKDDFNTCLRKNPLLITLFTNHLVQDLSESGFRMAEETV